MIKNKGNFMIKFEEQDKEFVENSDWEKLNEGYNKAKKQAKKYKFSILDYS